MPSVITRNCIVIFLIQIQVQEKGVKQASFIFQVTAVDILNRESFLLWYFPQVLVWLFPSLLKWILRAMLL